MTTKAHVEFDPASFGVRVAVQRRHEGESATEVLAWAPVCVKMVERGAEAPDDCWLRLNEDVARAIYEALADHFGHSGHDTRALRQDYNAERSRVDMLLEHLTRGA